MDIDIDKFNVNVVSYLLFINKIVKPKCKHLKKAFFMKPSKQYNMDPYIVYYN